ncbi:hypothetical protein ULMS_06650 [Patiriisocius marinistellae]|uniref:Alpha-ketoglutarate decarboxylase n=1 Tax=Patiriisocius marinistellae TaxID=2494560 RepID=A0A5J4FSL3_9FLAO|nr:hypothetical protein [Patiriisocius marinistellae]GEQ85157.1 hypothetical protein ULMS_06650 [Patiriisocius marinistellae]
MLFTQKVSNSIGLLSIFLCITFSTARAQEAGSSFWNNVDIGGGIGLNFGNGYFSGLIAPSAIYNFNEYFSAGPGLQYSYQSGNGFKSSLAGVSFIALANPIPQLQLSAEVEEAYVSQTVEFIEGNVSRDFWNTALFVGAGYRVGKGAIGLRYNLLFNDDDDIYTTAWAPFVRVYF